ncbi:methyltransferase domain-containing protein [Paenibacillus sp. N3/727]|uniref:methyltransferase domain-containing protein n=1 Tax=Paenibacillus sp. N3/727 TaxID=2925845 RepID=UPI001F52B5F9|nr:methyltransferase domain-containing protein [Paenibacillus sp. N3/727]UNK16270.1 methyltransferase domain-containing protein [Paenibacillus sp. N3/727]
MQYNSTYNIHNASLGLQTEIERLKVQALMGWDKEFRNLKWYGLENGMSVVELGSGPGFLTQQLVNSLPDSLITALEIEKTLLDKAQNMLNHIPEDRLRFVQSSIYETRLPDESFDFAIVRLLFLHLHNPMQAAQEIFRVLKPGGKLVIIDIDDGIFGAVNPDVQALPTVLKKIADHQATKGGNRYIGRSLPRLLTNAGYTDVDIDAVIQHSDIHGIEGFKLQFDINRFVGFFNNGLINQEEFDQLKSASEKISNSPDAYAMMTFVMAHGKKPEI